MMHGGSLLFGAFAAQLPVQLTPPCLAPPCRPAQSVPIPANSALLEAANGGVFKGQGITALTKLQGKGGRIIDYNLREFLLFTQNACTLITLLALHFGCSADACHVAGPATHATAPFSVPEKT